MKHPHRYCIYLTQNSSLSDYAFTSKNYLSQKYYSFPCHAAQCSQIEKNVIFLTTDVEIWQELLCNGTKLKYYYEQEKPKNNSEGRDVLPFQSERGKYQKVFPRHLAKLPREIIRLKGFSRYNSEWQENEHKKKRGEIIAPLLGLISIGCIPYFLIEKFPSSQLNSIKLSPSEEPRQRHSLATIKLTVSPNSSCSVVLIDSISKIALQQQSDLYCSTINYERALNVQPSGAIIMALCSAEVGAVDLKVRMKIINMIQKYLDSIDIWGLVTQSQILNAKLIILELILNVQFDKKRLGQFFTLNCHKFSILIIKPQRSSQIQLPLYSVLKQALVSKMQKQLSKVK